MKIICLILLLTFTLSGCQHLDNKRRAKYVLGHPELTETQKDLLSQGRLWTGMTTDEVKASLGNPARDLKGLYDKKQVWTYHYKDQFTTHAKTRFDRVLLLEFIEGRLAAWRED